MELRDFLAASAAFTRDHEISIIELLLLVVGFRLRGAEKDRRGEDGQHTREAQPMKAHKMP